MIALIAAMSAIVIGGSFAYLWAMVVAGLRILRRENSSLGALASIHYDNPYRDEPGTFHTYFLVPCLNEEAIIGHTTRALAGSPSATVIVIDDASDDATAAVAEAAGGDSTIVHRRVAPLARQGKGEALNDALALVRRLVEERGQNVDEVLVTVMDADGRLSDGAMAAVLPLFDDPAVGAVQLAVRIRNRQRFLTRFQDFHFWSLTAIAQIGRKATDTVSLGGNGQFSRLSALNDAGVAPWSKSLTEDLDLAVTLALRGWKLSTTPHAAVEQQGVEQIRILVKQRRRWYQGHMMMASRLPEIWSSPAIGHKRVLELTSYIVMPWVSVLPWSILFHFALFGIVTNPASAFAYIVNPVSLVVGLSLWYLVTFGPVFFSAWVYYKRDDRRELWQSLLLAHCFPLMNYIAFVAVWSALVRIIRGQNGWEKTRRTVEHHLESESESATAGPLRKALS